MTPEAAIAWAAGLFEGEGCITGRVGGSDIVAVISMCDADVVRRFRHVVGMGAVRPSPRRDGQHKKLQWRWQVNGDEAEVVIRLLLPYLGRRRTDRANEMLQRRAAWRTAVMADRICQRCGRMFQRRHATRLYCSRLCGSRAADESYRRRTGAEPKGKAKRCRNGHLYTKKNTSIAPQGWRRCRTCSRANSARYSARKRALV